MSVSELNNTAVSLFERGYHNDAIRCLRAAIDQLVQDIRNRSHIVLSSSHQTSELPEDANRSFTCHLMRRQYPLRMMGHSSNCFTRSISNRRISMCDDEVSAVSASSLYGFTVLLFDSFQYSSSAECSMDQTSAVLLYNMALIHHWKAVHFGISKALLKALKVYCMALEVINETEVAGVEVLLLAIWNNMGHIHTQLFQLIEARVCFSKLRLILEDRDIRRRLPESDFQFFLLSAISRVWEIHLAPAA